MARAALHSEQQPTWRIRNPVLRVLGIGVLAIILGCASQRHAGTAAVPPTGYVAAPPSPVQQPAIVFTAHRETVKITAADALVDLEMLALAANPRLVRLRQEASAAQAKTAYVDKLPDPTVGVNVFGHPIETAAGSQRANMTVMQMIPWLSRLDAQAQQAAYEALSLQQAYDSERLKILGDLRALWYRLYSLDRQIETNRANQEFLQSLIDVANARVSTGQASQGDVLLGVLELGKLEEELLTLRQQSVSVKAELNRLAARPTNHPIDAPQELNISLPNWSYEMLQQIGRERQPEIAAAELRTQATRWGVEVARLKFRPDLSLSASWFAIDDNRPASTIVDVGEDAWAIGAMVSVPLWRHKYDAMAREASWRHAAAHASVDDVVQQYDYLLRDLWEKAKTADEMAQLYKHTLLPQAQQTLEADQQSYSNGAVEFDRIIRDFRSVLMLELGYHRATAELAIAIARLQQAVGVDLADANRQPADLPAPAENRG